MLDRLAREVEALLMACETSLSIEYLCELTGSGPDSIEQALGRVGRSLDEGGHSMTVLNVAGGYRLATRQEYGTLVSQLFEGRRPGRLTRAALETLAVIAYSQPCTRASIESVRGVNCDSALRTLLERELVRIEGRQESPGRPLLYATTNRFLEYFGLSSIDHLPRLDEIGELLAGGLEDIEAVLPEQGPARGDDAEEEEEL
jgi:segregation and condensation protein B